MKTIKWSIRIAAWVFCLAVVKAASDTTTLPTHNQPNQTSSFGARLWPAFPLDNKGMLVSYQSSFEPSTRKSVVRVSHISQTAVAIGCLNGADPTGTKVEGALIISCGR